eukprot:6733992-Pyramimonas_sp.AAC.1
MRGPHRRHRDSLWMPGAHFGGPLTRFVSERGVSTVRFGALSEHPSHALRLHEGAPTGRLGLISEHPSHAVLPCL